MNMTIDITEAISFDPEALEPINRLLAQLTDRRPLAADDLRRIVEDEATHLFHAMGYARRMSPATLMLTSRPSRAAANALYLAAGFEPKETNVYKIEL